MTDIYNRYTIESKEGYDNNNFGYWVKYFPTYLITNTGYSIYFKNKLESNDLNNLNYLEATCYTSLRFYNEVKNLFCENIDKSYIPNDYRIYSFNDSYFVLTTSKELTLDVLMNEECVIDEDDLDIYEIKECSHNEETFLPIDTVKGIFSTEEIDKIKEILKNEDDDTSIVKENKEYWFYDSPYDLEGYYVLLTFDQILNDPRIFFNIDKDTLLCQNI